MKAIQFRQLGGAEVLEYGEVPKPEPRPGTVLVKNHAIGVNFADTLFRQGQYWRKPELPDTPGSESAGIVEAVGTGVSGVMAGDRVAVMRADRTYADYCAAAPEQIFPLPDFISFEDGANLIQPLTSWHMLHTMHQVAAGQTVVVHSAAGGCGIVAVQIAKALGAQVIGTVSSDAKIEFVRRYGADHVINYATHDFAAEVLRITGGRGAGLVLDAIGKPTFEQGVKCLAPFGHIILYGRSGGPPDRFNLFKLADKSLKVSFFFLWTVFEVAGLMQRGLDGCFQLMREGKLKQVVGRTFPLHEAAAAHRLIESRGSIGKLLLIPHHAMSR